MNQLSKIFFYSLILIAVSIVFITLKEGLKSNTLPDDGVSLDGKRLDMENLYDVTTGQKVELKSLTLVHVYLSRCHACHEDHRLLATYKGRSCLSFIGLKWQDDNRLLDAKTAHLIESAYNAKWDAKETHTFVKLGMKTSPIALLVDDSGTIVMHHRNRLTQEILSQFMQYCDK
jgi:hypothetical protein